MKLEIFDVEHGACALLTCDNDRRIMIDCGHNSETGWKPGGYLREQGISNLDMLVISNYDEDHVSGLPDLLENVKVDILLRNKSLTPELIKSIKSENGIGVGMKALINMALTYTGSVNLSPDFFLGVNRQAFFNTYPSFLDTNNLSVVTHFNIKGVNFLFPGDLESLGWKSLLEKPDFSSAVQQTNVLVASHHGRESGICEDIFDLHKCNPWYVVFSDKGHMYSTQQTISYYASKAKGGPFRYEEKRYVLTTRNDGTITFNFGNESWGPM